MKTITLDDVASYVYVSTGDISPDCIPMIRSLVVITIKPERKCYIPQTLIEIYRIERDPSCPEDERFYTMINGYKLDYSLTQELNKYIDQKIAQTILEV